MKRYALALAILSSIFPRWQDTETLPANDIPMGCVIVAQPKLEAPHRTTCRIWHRGYRY